MLRFLKQLFRDEKGQALPIVLALLAIGSLTIAVNLNYATTSLKGSGIVDEDMRGVYAAAAGVEQVLWSLNKGLSPPTATSDNINQMAISMETITGTELLTLLLDDLTTGVHGAWVTVSNNITFVGGTTYQYTIIVSTGGQYNNKKLTEFGALLPSGYTYVTNSAAAFHATNLSTTGDPSIDNPTHTGYDTVGSQWVKWYWNSKGPSLTKDSTYTEKFQISGTGSTWGSYAWVIGQSGDIGTVGQVTGTLTTITSTARRPQDGKITAKIKVNVIKGSGGVYVFSWQITE